jgi:hypothetical protein
MAWEVQVLAVTSYNAILSEDQARSNCRPGRQSVFIWRLRHLLPICIKKIGPRKLLLEIHRVSRTEILQMLQRVLRQHTLVRLRKIDHAVIWLPAL